eukprot:scaffold104723_cov33-Tisochrysis_lutea.AAC.1
MWVNDGPPPRRVSARWGGNEAPRASPLTPITQIGNRLSLLAANSEPGPPGCWRHNIIAPTSFAHPPTVASTLFTPLLEQPRVQISIAKSQLVGAVANQVLILRHGWTWSSLIPHISNHASMHTRDAARMRPPRHISEAKECLSTGSAGLRTTKRIDHQVGRSDRNYAVVSRMIYCNRAACHAHRPSISFLLLSVSAHNDGRGKKAGLLGGKHPCTVAAHGLAGEIDALNIAA